MIRFLLDVRVLKIIGQIIFLIAFVAAMYWLFNNFQTNLNSSGLKFSFRFVNETAGFDIADPAIDYDSTRSNGYAFLTGVVNSLRVILLGILFATILGAVVGVARLSTNWLLQRLATFYVEVIRNIPLPVQLHFLYFGAILTAFPRVQENIDLFGLGIFHLHQRGLTMPWPLPTEAFDFWRFIVLGGIVVAAIIFLLRKAHLRRIDRPGFPLLWALGGFVTISGIGWFLAPGSPFALDMPVLGRFNFTGGLQISAMFFGLLIGLVVYTASFIAEIVRSGIQSVSKGQREAAIAAGLNAMQVLRLVIMPQALRVIVPPLTSQYLNLAKNSSLAIIIGYSDLFAVGQTIFNQTGRAPEVLIMVMISYLIFSLITSVFMNIYNRKIKLVER